MSAQGKISPRLIVSFDISTVFSPPSPRIHIYEVDDLGLMHRGLDKLIDMLNELAKS